MNVLIHDTNSIKLIGVVAVDKVARIEQHIAYLTHEDEIKRFLASKNITEGSFKCGGYLALIETLISSTSAEFQHFIRFIRVNNDLRLREHLSGNIIDIAISKGFTSEFTKRLLNLCLINVYGNHVGAGEILFAILFTDVKKTRKDGDLLFEDKELEVKCRGGRFGMRPGKSNTQTDLFVRDLLSTDQLTQYNYIYGNDNKIENQIVNGFKFTQQFSNYHNNPSLYFDNVAKKLVQLCSFMPDIIQQYLQPYHYVYPASTIKTVLTKIYIASNMCSKAVTTALFIDKHDNYLVATANDILKPYGLVENGALKVSNFKFNDYHPQVNLINTNNGKIQKFLLFEKET